MGQRTIHRPGDARTLQGLRRGCKRVFLETLSFQALAFYQKLGYVVQHRLEGFPPGGARYALTKEHGVAPPEL